MNFRQFLAALRKLPRDHWTLGACNKIRYCVPQACALKFCCPITAIHPEKLGESCYQRAAKDLGINTKLMSEIVDAADNQICRSDPKKKLLIRRRALILKACGLTGK